MNLHEYQAKQLFARYRIPVTRGEVASTPAQAAAAADRLGGDGRLRQAGQQEQQPPSWFSSP